MAELKIAHLFLQGFVKELIKNAFIRNPNIFSVEAMPEEELVQKEEKTESLKMLPTAERPINLSGTDFRGGQIIKLLTPGRYQRGVSFGVYTPQKNRIKKQYIQLGSSQNPAWAKIEFLLRDPAITDIECMGANKNLLVKKGGMIQITQVILTEDEIINLLNEFSAKTRIPIIGGTFKAAADNLIMTAIISEVLGPRFIMQKRSPFQKLISF